MTTSPVRLERRAGQRFDFHLPVSVQLSGSAHAACGFTQDLSARGSFFYTDYPLGVGESVELTLVMQSKHLPLGLAVLLSQCSRSTAVRHTALDMGIGQNTLAFLARERHS